MASQKEIRQAKAAYLREWRRKNPEKVKQYTQSYWARRIDRMQVEQNQTAGATPEKERN